MAPSLLKEPDPVVKRLQGEARGRQKFIYEGKVVYEWEQDLDEAHIYIDPPPGVTKLDLDIKITPRNVKIGLRGNPPFLDEELFSRADTDCSFWMLEDREKTDQSTKTESSNDGPSSSNQSSPEPATVSHSKSPSRELHIILGKAHKGETWSSVFRRHGQMDLFTEQETQKKLMLERFQEEHPGFDFSQAEFSGQSPDARNFMGGISY